MIKALSIYAIWVFISSIFLKSGIELIIDQRIPWGSVFLITIFLHIAVVLPITNSINILTGKIDENR